MEAGTFGPVAQHKGDPQGHGASALVLQSEVRAERVVILGAFTLRSLVCPTHCIHTPSCYLRDSDIRWLNVSSGLEGS